MWKPCEAGVQVVSNFSKWGCLLPIHQFCSPSSDPQAPKKRRLALSLAPNPPPPHSIGAKKRRRGAVGAHAVLVLRALVPAHRHPAEARLHRQGGTQQTPVLVLPPAQKKEKKAPEGETQKTTGGAPANAWDSKKAWWSQASENYAGIFFAVPGWCQRKRQKD